MNQKQYIGKRISSFELLDSVGPITGVALLIDDENEIFVGDESGYVLEIDCPYGTEDMAQNILSEVSGQVYKAYRGEGAIVSPTAELGDGVTVNGIYSVLAYRNVSFGADHVSEISAPGESTLENEYPYIGTIEKKFTRKIAQTRSLITKTAEEIRLEVQSEIDALSSSFSVELEAITAEVNGLNGAYTKLQLTVDGLTVTDSSGTTKIKGSSIETDSLYVNAANISGTLTASQVNLTGAITFNDLSSDVNNSISGISDLAINAYTKANSVESQVSAWTYSGTTYIDGTKILTGTVTASYLYGGVIGLKDASGVTVGTMALSSATSGAYAIALSSNAAMRMEAADGDIWIQAHGLFSPSLWLRTGVADGAVSCDGHFWPAEDGIYNLGRSDHMWNGIYSSTCAASASDRNVKHSIMDIPEEYVTLFMGLKPRIYKYNNGTSDRYHIGYIAQEVEEAMLVAGISSQDFAALVIDTDEEGNKIYMLRYEEFMALHTMMIQRLVNQNG